MGNQMSFQANTAEPELSINMFDPGAARRPLAPTDKRCSASSASGLQRASSDDIDDAGTGAMVVHPPTVSPQSSPRVSDAIVLRRDDIGDADDAAADDLVGQMEPPPRGALLLKCGQRERHTWDGA